MAVLWCELVNFIAFFGFSGLNVDGDFCILCALVYKDFASKDVHHGGSSTCVTLLF